MPRSRGVWPRPEAAPGEPPRVRGAERRVLRAVGFVPVEAKLRLPTHDDTLVLRGHIVDRLLESGDTPVVLITAPPGYGKTVVAEQWAHEDERPFAWLSMDGSDNEPHVLLTYLMLALQRIEPVDAGVLALLAGEESIAEVVLPRLGRMLRQRTDPFVLVLDDADVLTGSAALAVVDTLARHLPDGSQLAMLAQRPPDLDWSTLRVQRRLLELGASSLRLSLPEATALLEATGVQLAEQDVAVLLERTEGWAAGVYLAALSFSVADKQRRAVEAFAGSDNTVATYLRDHLLAGLAPEDQAFLIRTSILHRLSGPLCDAVLSTAGSAARLTRLAGDNVLLVPLDRESRWFRLHHLFAEALRAELTRREPEVVKQLHSLASRWLQEAGDVTEAVEHSIAAGETGRTARLVWSVTSDLLGGGEVARLEGWLDHFTPREVAAHAKLALTSAWCSLQRGRPADHWLSAAEMGLYDADREGESESIAAATALLRAMLARNGLAQMGADARLAMRLQDPDDPWRCTASYLDAVSTYLTGHPGEARVALNEVEQLAEAFNAYQIVAAACCQLALIAVERNDWRGAETLVQRSAAVSEEHGLQSGGALLIAVPCVEALLQARQGRTEEATARARRAVSVVALASHLPAWTFVQCHYVLARTQLMLGDASAARVLLSEALAGSSDVADALVLREMLEKTWRQIEKMPLGFERGASTLTTAELRVLQYLPTHLSFEQIGRRLFVSRNTVKTQAIAAYRKLGVTSRTEAVERAYALGLMGD